MGLTLAQFDRLPADERALRIERWNVKRATCPDCGNPIAECSDPDILWYPYRRVCYATMNREGAGDAYAALHGEDAAYHDGTFTDWGKVRSADHPYSAMAGVSIGVAKTDLAPWDDFTTNRDASPVRSVAEQAPGEQDDADPSGGDGQGPDED